MVGYHFYIRKDGQVQAGRKLPMVGAHTLNYNHDSIGICLGGSSHFTDAQFRSLKGLIDSILAQLKTYGNKGIPTMHGHCEFDKLKTCPNFNYKKFIRDNNYA
jgi:N-acetyl-anhydromuramyl-L-alanine amidase AmpD